MPASSDADLFKCRPANQVGQLDLRLDFWVFENRFGVWEWMKRLNRYAEVSGRRAGRLELSNAFHCIPHLYTVTDSYLQASPTGPAEKNLLIYIFLNAIRGILKSWDRKLADINSAYYVIMLSNGMPSH